MVAHLEPTLQETGAWMYPRLFWETGVLGQVLYLEAHAVGVSATGIGCFFDDPGMPSFLSSILKFSLGYIITPRNLDVLSCECFASLEW